MAELLGTVRRALRVLDYLAERDASVPIKRLAADLELNLSSAYHLLNTLAADGYAARDERGGGYALGAKAARLGDAFARAWRAEPRLQTLVGELAGRTDETAGLAMASGRDLVVTAVVESRQPVRVHALERGACDDRHAHALGKAVLAFAADDDLRAHLAQHPPRRLTPRTLTSPAELRAEFERVRRRGYSEDLEEAAPGVCALAAPFFAPGGAPAGALAVCVPAFRYRAARPALRAAVVSSAMAATALLSGLPR